VYGSQRRWAEALSGNQPFWQINFLFLLLMTELNQIPEKTKAQNSTVEQRL